MARESTIGSVFKLEKLPAAAGVAITAITKGATTEVTTTVTGIAVGDFVRVANTGMPELDRNTVHRVSAVGTGVLTLDTDSSGGDVPATIPSEATLYEATFDEVCFAEFGLDAPTPSEIDVTTMCDVERRNVPGLASTGSASFGGPLDLSDTGIKALLAAYYDAQSRNLLWVTRQGQTGIMYGVVSSFSGAPQGVEQAVTFSGSFQVQERAIYLEPMA